MFIFWEREHKWGRGIEMGTEDPKQALRWQQWARWGTRTRKLWDHDLSWSRMLIWLSHPGTLQATIFTLYGSYVCKFVYLPKFICNSKISTCTLLGSHANLHRAGGSLSHLTYFPTWSWTRVSCLFIPLSYSKQASFSWYFQCHAVCIF